MTGSPVLLGGSLWVGQVKAVHPEEVTVDTPVGKQRELVIVVDAEIDPKLKFYEGVQITTDQPAVGGGAFVVILDVGAGLKGGSPERPQLVSQLRFNHNELYGNGWLAGTHSVYRYKNYVFIGDEVFPAIFDIKSPKRFPIRGIVHVVDVSDINNPRKVAEYPVPEGAAHNMWVEDDVMYVGYYSGGGRIVACLNKERDKLADACKKVVDAQKK